MLGRLPGFNFYKVTNNKFFPEYPDSRNCSGKYDILYSVCIQSNLYFYGTK